MKNHDLNTLDELIHDDLLFVIPTGQTVSKQMDLDNFRSGRLQIEAIRWEEPEIRVMGDTALVVVALELKDSFADQPFSGQFSYFRTWKRFDDRWRVIGGAGIQL